MFHWYNIFNLQTFIATGLTSRTYTFFLDGVGEKTLLATKGETYGITYEGVFLSINMNGKNPFRYDVHAVFLDEQNNVWLGIYEETDAD